MLHPYQANEPTTPITEEELFAAVELLRHEGRRLWKLASEDSLGHQSENFKKGKAFFIAAAELEKTYAKVGIRLGLTPGQII